MRRFLTVCVWMAAASSVWAGAAAVGSLTFHPDTGQVSISTTCASPTVVLSTTSFISHSLLVNPSSWTVLYISTASTGLSPTTSFQIPTNSSFSPDGPMDAYDGPMFACSSTSIAGVQAITGSPKISVLRVK